jgi:hypothetical protein
MYHWFHVLNFEHHFHFFWLGFCNQCNLACFCWSINFDHSSSADGLLWFSFSYPRLSLGEVLIFSLILSQALLMLDLSSKFSKAANLFEISTRYFSSTSTSSSFVRSNLSKSNFYLAGLLTEIPSFNFDTK